MCGSRELSRPAERDEERKIGEDVFSVRESGVPPRLLFEVGSQQLKTGILVDGEVLQQEIIEALGGGAILCI